MRRGVRRNVIVMRMRMACQRAWVHSSSNSGHCHVTGSETFLGEKEIIESIFRVMNECIPRVLWMPRNQFVQLVGTIIQLTLRRSVDRSSCSSRPGN